MNHQSKLSSLCAVILFAACAANAQAKPVGNCVNAALHTQQQQPGMPPPGFDPNVRLINACSEPRRLLYDYGTGGSETDTLNSNSTFFKRMRVGTKIYLINAEGNKQQIHTVGNTEDQEVHVCG